MHAKIGQIVVVDGEPHIVLETRGDPGLVMKTEPVRDYYMRVMMDPDDPTRTLAERASVREP